MMDHPISAEILGPGMTGAEGSGVGSGDLSCEINIATRRPFQRSLPPAGRAS